MSGPCSQGATAPEVESVTWAGVRSVVGHEARSAYKSEGALTQGRQVSTSLREALQPGAFFGEPLKASRYQLIPLQ